MSYLRQYTATSQIRRSLTLEGAPIVPWRVTSLHLLVVFIAGPSLQGAVLRKKSGSGGAEGSCRQLTPGKVPGGVPGQDACQQLWPARDWLRERHQEFWQAGSEGLLPAALWAEDDDHRTRGRRETRPGDQFDDNTEDPDKLLEL